MGWLFRYNWRTRTDMLNHLRRPERFGDNCVLLKSQAVGNNHWYLVRNKTADKVFIGLDMMQGGTKRDPGWGYKDLDESCGPCAVNCPLGYLKLASEPTGYAVEWRESVRQYHAKRNITPVAGARIEYCSTAYVLQRPAGPRKGWHVLREADGRPFRMKANQVAQSKPLDV